MGRADAEIRELFDRFRSFIETCGPVIVYAQESRIVFQARVRFAEVRVRRGHFDCGFWLKRRATHPLIWRLDAIPPGDFTHYFRLQHWEEFDQELQGMIREAYLVGRQQVMDT